jgi:hypothetical protein
VTGELCELENPPEARDAVFEPGVSATQRANLLGKDDVFCKMCGTAPGDIDDLTGAKAKFHIGLIADKVVGSTDELSNLRILCSSCAEGVKSLRVAKPTRIWLLSQVRRAGQDEQLAVLKWLREKFKV